MYNPLGSDGLLAHIAEQIPIVNNGMQGLHYLVGNDKAYERAHQRDPLGSNGYITQTAELIPGVNSALQRLHHATGQEEALERARRRDLVGQDGYVTQAAELVPGMDLVMQAAHQTVGNDEALGRARRRSPTLVMANHLPVLNDAMAQVHALAGQEDEAQLAHARSLTAAFSKDGAVTRAAELLPVSNLVVALLHQVSGNYEEASRAVNLIQSWQEAGGTGGALSRIAEVVPIVDLMAFAMHIHQENYAEALRNIAKSPRINLTVESANICLAWGARVSELQVADFQAHGAEIAPKSASLSGALVDIMAHRLHEARPGVRNRGIKASMQEGLQTAFTAVVQWKLEQAPQYTADAIDSANAMLAEQRWLRLELPPPSPALGEAAQRLMSRSTFRHYDALPGAPEIAPHTSKEGERVSKAMGAASCLSLAACLAGVHQLAGLVCITGAIAGVTKLGCKLGSKVAPWLSRHNSRAMTDLRDHCVRQPEPTVAAETDGQAQPTPWVMTEEMGIVYRIWQMAKYAAQGAAYELKHEIQDPDTVPGWGKMREESARVKSVWVGPVGSLEALEEMVLAGAWGAACSSQFGEDSDEAQNTWMRFDSAADSMQEVLAPLGLDGPAEDLKWMIFHICWVQANELWLGEGSAEAQEDLARAEEHSSRLEFRALVRDDTEDVFPGTPHEALGPGVVIEAQQDDVGEMADIACRHLCDAASCHPLKRQALRLAKVMLWGFVRHFWRDSEILPLVVPYDVPTAWVTDDENFAEQHPMMRANILYELQAAQGELRIKRARMLIPDVLWGQGCEALQSQLALTDLRTLDKRLAGFTQAVHVLSNVGVSWVRPDLMNIRIKAFQSTLHLPT